MKENRIYSFLIFSAIVFYLMSLNGCSTKKYIHPSTADGLRCAQEAKLQKVACERKIQEDKNNCQQNAKNAAMPAFQNAQQRFYSERNDYTECQAKRNKMKSVQRAANSKYSKCLERQKTYNSCKFEYNNNPKPRKWVKGGRWGTPRLTTLSLKQVCGTAISCTNPLNQFSQLPYCSEPREPQLNDYVQDSHCNSYESSGCRQEYDIRFEACGGAIVID